MAKHPFPSKEAVLKFIRESEVPPTKRELARAFHIKGDDRIALKRLVRELQKEGVLPGGKKRAAKARKQAPGIVELEVVGFTSSGELQARKVDFDSEQPDEAGEAFTLVLNDAEDSPAPGVRVLAALDLENPESRTATVIRVLPSRMTHVLGILHGEGEHAVVEPVNRKIRESFVVPSDYRMGAKDGELVYCQLLQTGKPSGRPDRHRKKKDMLQPVKVIERVGRMDAPKSASMIAIHNQDIPIEFSPEAISIAKSAKPPVLSGRRVDLRDIPLVTIDGPDARDFDDAVWAEPDAKNKGGWHLMVAIADVAHYVRFGSQLDDEAFERGNSVYFPDRVVPMLPEALSNGLCSLNPDEDRFCLAVHLWIDAEGNTTNYQFVRGIMRSRKRLTYEQVQAAHDGEPVLEPEFVEKIIQPLYGVYAALDKNRSIRGALELDLPEHKVQINAKTGLVENIELRERFDSHKLIEECMIAANVAAAHAIETADAPGMFRVHERPDIERTTNLRSFLKQMGYAISQQEQLSAHHFNKVLEEAHEKPEAHVIHMSILRSQMAAYYHPKNLGHFGLSLEKYCHYTSPIRRYSDLIVHRTLIDIFDMADRETDGLKLEQAENLDSIATHISQTERRAMLAEREANDRYIAGFMADKVGKEFDAIIAGIISAGFFVEVKENGVQGLVPIRSIRGDYWLFDKDKQRFIGRSTGETFTLGQRVRVMLVESNTLTGSLQFGLVGREVQADRRNHKGKPPSPPGKNFKGKGKRKFKGKGGKQKGKKSAGKAGK